MKSIGFTLVSVVLVGFLLVGGYFAITHLKSPASYVPASSQTVGDLQVIATDPDTNTTSPASAGVTTAVTNPPPVATGTTSSSGSATSSTLSANLKTLIANKTTLKVGSKGTNVGYLEQFMNLYLKKTSKIDNVFGKTLQANVKTFQKQNKLSQEGTVGPQTLQAMVSWLANNS